MLEPMLKLSEIQQILFELNTSTICILWVSVSNTCVNTTFKGSVQVSRDWN